MTHRRLTRRWERATLLVAALILTSGCSPKTYAINMIDVTWMPLIGGTVISLQAWEQIPAQSRPTMLEAAHAAGERLRGDIRAMGDDAVREMEKRGLTVIRVDAATRALWQSSAEQAYPRLRGSYCPADLFDEVQRVKTEFRR